jgi:hypothetical protein
MLTVPTVYNGWFLAPDLRPNRAHPMVADAVLAVAPRNWLYIGAKPGSLSYGGSNPPPQNVIYPSGRTFRSSGGTAGWEFVNPLYGGGGTYREYSVGLFGSGYYNGTRGRFVDMGTGVGAYCFGIQVDAAGVLRVDTVDTSNNVSTVTASTPYQDIAQGFCVVLTQQADKRARMYLRTASGRKEYGIGSALAGTPTNLATNQYFSLFCNQDLPKQPNVWGGVSHFVVWPFALDDGRAWQFAENPLGNFTAPRSLLSSRVASASGSPARPRGMMWQ